LNDADLIQARKSAIEGLFQYISTLSPNEVKQLVLFYQSIDTEGNYKPFCVALLYFIKQYFKI